MAGSDGKKGEWRNVLVDCGKSFVENARRFFPRWGVKTIDAVLLTHGRELRHSSSLLSWRRVHADDTTGIVDADAYFGLDDLREWCIRQRRFIPIYLNRDTYDAVALSFPYLVDASKASGGGDL